MRRTIHSTAVVAILLLSGCGVDSSVVRGQALWDYEPSPTLTADIDRWDVAVSGKVRSWSPGRSIHDDGTVAHWAVLAVDVEDAAKVVDESQREAVYFSVLLGHDLLEPDKESAAETRASRLAEFEEAVPAGTRIIGIGPMENNSPEQYSATVRVEQPAEDPTGGAPLVALSTQGGILETGTGGFDAMRAEVVDLASWAAHAAQLAVTTPGPTTRAAALTTSPQSWPSTSRSDLIERSRTSGGPWSDQATPQATHETGKRLQVASPVSLLFSASSVFGTDAVLIARQLVRPRHEPSVRSRRLRAAVRGEHQFRSRTKSTCSNREGPLVTPDRRPGWIGTGTPASWASWFANWRQEK
ncbi:hypothetical protein [Nocardioides zeae]|uniref:Uncharacterized protein n=1 Tax=Nocardioides zeae TaxID=1457234 RepID=A0A6P0HFY4_9ACTN|nr:hypothetical protein [Nocardioides zeae]NEN77436.1 hypothetical protein [Nocardioides zeae]